MFSEKVRCSTQLTQRHLYLIKLYCCLWYGNLNSQTVKLKQLWILSKWESVVPAALLSDLLKLESFVKCVHRWMSVLYVGVHRHLTMATSTFSFSFFLFIYFFWAHLLQTSGWMRVLSSFLSDVSHAVTMATPYPFITTLSPVSSSKPVIRVQIILRRPVRPTDFLG